MRMHESTHHLVSAPVACSLNRSPHRPGSGCLNSAWACRLWACRRLEKLVHQGAWGPGQWDQ